MGRSLTICPATRWPMESPPLTSAARSRRWSQRRWIIFLARRATWRGRWARPLERRDGQAEMAARVLDSLNRGDHLLIEAGTGTGQEPGLPTAERAVERAERAARGDRDLHAGAAGAADRKRSAAPG